jgi:hypothetical protein
MSNNSPKPVNITLYNNVKSLTNKKFKSPSGVYRSAWIVKEYKKRGGTYKSPKSKKMIGLKRWFKENWVDLNRPVGKNSKGKIIYDKCGRSRKKEKYPLCRPSKRITSKSPTTYKELSKYSISKAKKLKKSSSSIRFTKRKSRKKVKVEIL